MMDWIPKDLHLQKRNVAKKYDQMPPGPQSPTQLHNTHSMNKKQRTVSPVTPATADKDGELADLEKIMDSFDMDERVIGTIVKLDDGGLQGISDSPPRITLSNETVTLMNTVYHEQSSPEIEGNSHFSSTSTVKLTGVTSHACVHIDNIKNAASNLGVDTVSLDSAETEGVTSNTITEPNVNLVTPVNAALEGVTPNPPSSQLIMTPVPASTSDNGNPAKNGDAVTPVNEKHKDSETLLLDLVTNHNNSTTMAVLSASNSADEGVVMLANTGEFDFPALSSKEDNGQTTPLTSSIHEHVNSNEPAEIQLTEEEDDAVSALLSLSKSLPSENSQEDLDNSELLPIGKVTIDAAPVPIRLGVDDVNREIAKLKVPNDANETNGTPEPKQTLEVTR